MRPTTQSIIEGGLKNGALSPLLHLGLFVGSMYFVYPSPDFSKEGLGQETCKAQFDEQKIALELLLGTHLFGFIFQTAEYMIKGHQGRNQRSLSLITFLNSLLVIAYHAALIFALKRLTLERTLQLSCGIYDSE